MLTGHELTGRVRSHVVQLTEPRFAAQHGVAQAFLDMRSDARRDGIDLLPYSSFRDFRTQLRIWNAKFSGKATLYDMDGRPRDHAALSPDQVVDAILNWSAVPGGSRHQWGTEIDVVDGAVMPPGYVPQLLPVEVREGGLFAPLHRWLDTHIARYGFFRPYAAYQGGMYPEPWHLSYAPLATRALEQLSVEVLHRAIEEADVLGKELLLRRLPGIFEHHIRNIVPPDVPGGA